MFTVMNGKRNFMVNITFFGSVEQYAGRRLRPAEPSNRKIVIIAYTVLKGDITTMACFIVSRFC